MEFFTNLGVPTRLRSDNGPQFEAHAFQSMLRNWGVVWGNSTPGYSQSNGDAEAAVAAIKHLVAKIAPTLKLSPRGCWSSGIAPEKMKFCLGVVLGI